MKVRVKLFATLRDRSPERLDIGEAFTIKLDTDSTVIDLLDHLNILREEAKIVMINHTTVLDFSNPLKNGDEIAIFPPIGGG